MFKRIANAITDIRINRAYPAYETRCKIAHMEQAEREFPTRALETTKSALEEAIRVAANEKFNHLLVEPNTHRNHYQACYNKTFQMHSVFTTHYKTELALVREKLASNKREIQEIHRQRKMEEEEAHAAIKSEKSDLEDAYSCSNLARSNIDRWHKKSKRRPIFLGTKGKAIPNHSLFRQSHGDLDHYHNAKRRAGNDIGDCKNAISDLRDKISRIKDAAFNKIVRLKKIQATLVLEMDRLKECRNRMYELKDQGHTSKKLESELFCLRKDIQKYDNVVDTINREKQIYIDIERIAHGVPDIVNEIKLIQHERCLYIDRFNTPELKHERVLAHRVEWLASR